LKLEGRIARPPTLLQYAQRQRLAPAV
jgi:hypothetical protein